MRRKIDWSTEPKRKARLNLTERAVCREMVSQIDRLAMRWHLNFTEVELRLISDSLKTHAQNETP